MTKASLSDDALFETIIDKGTFDALLCTDSASHVSTPKFRMQFISLNQNLLRLGPMMSCCTTIRGLLQVPKSLDVLSSSCPMVPSKEIPNVLLCKNRYLTEVPICLLFVLILASVCATKQTSDFVLCNLWIPNERPRVLNVPCSSHWCVPRNETCTTFRLPMRGPKSILCALLLALMLRRRSLSFTWQGFSFAGLLRFCVR